MKKIILILGNFLLTLTLNANAQDNPVKIENDTEDSSLYCVMLMDGKTMLMTEGKQVYTDIKLDNGIIIMTDGTVQKIDKTIISLKNGDCIDQDGNIIPADKRRVKRIK